MAQTISINMKRGKKREFLKFMQHIYHENLLSSFSPVNGDR